MKKIIITIKNFFKQSELKRKQEEVKRIHNFFTIEEAQGRAISIVCNGVTIKTFRNASVEEVIIALEDYRDEAIRVKLHELNYDIGNH